MNKSEASARAALIIDAWIKERSIAIHRDDRWWLIEKVAEEFSRETEDAKRPDGVG